MDKLSATSQHLLWKEIRGQEHSYFVLQPRQFLSESLVVVIKAKNSNEYHHFVLENLNEYYYR